MLIDEMSIQRHVGSRAMELGRVYRRQGRVSSLEKDDLRISALVRGTLHLPYKVEIVPHSSGKSGFKSSCTCPVGSFCKHVAATLLESLETSGKKEEVKPAPAPAQATPRPIQVHPAILPKDELPASIVHWLDVLQKADNKSEDYPDGVHQRLIYILRVATDRHGTPLLKLDVASTRILKDGSLSKTVSHPNLSNVERDTQSKFIRPADRRIARLLNWSRGAYSSIDTSLNKESAWEVIDAALATGRLRLDDVHGLPLKAGPARSARISWTLGSDAHLRPFLETDSGLLTFPATPPGYIDRETGEIARLDVGLNPALASTILDAPAVPLQHAPAFAAAMEKRAPGAAKARPISSMKMVRVEENPTPVLRLFKADLPLESEPGGRFNSHAQRQEKESVGLGRLSFRYGQGTVAHGETKLMVTALSEGRVLEIVRSPSLEKAATKLLADLDVFEATRVRPNTPHAHRQDFLPKGGDFDWLDIMHDSLPSLRDHGFVIEIAEDFPYRLLRGEAQVDAEIRNSSGIDWFELDLGVIIDGERMDLVGPLCKLISAPDFDIASYDAVDGADAPIFLQMPDGRFLSLPSSRLKPLINALYELTGGDWQSGPSGKVRISASDAAALADFEDATLSAGLVWRGGEALREMGRKLKDVGGIPRVTPPADFAADLRPYQIEGLSWLSFLCGIGLGGILADDMGLGKTIQALALIALEKAAGRLDLPVLVIAPTSLMGNWRKEAEKFAPNLRVLTLQGLDRKEKFDAIGESDIVLTTYPLIARDKDVLATRQWSIMFLDEAQTVKNPEATTTRIINEMTARVRIALTGTPLENHLGELWSLFNVVSPGFLGDKTWFANAYRTPIEKKGEKSRGRHLARRIKPFLLRRTKEEVATELPPKTEIIERVDMANDQRDLYESIRLAMHEKVLAAISANGLNRSRIIVLDALLKMRQACCDPRLLKRVGKGASTAGSAKLERLEELLTELVSEDRRILIFSQFTSMLDLIRIRLDELNLDYSLLTGDTRDRPKEIDAFQNGEKKIFLISLKAGGVGLNLTAADTIILYDPWWNPAVEDQAIDRAHRIGQDKPVFVYKLTMNGTIEEKMEELKARKRALAESLFDADGAPTLAMTEADIQLLFAA